MVIQVENIRKSYKKNLKTIDALNGVSLSVNRGRIAGVLGPNGAGKTTLLKIITGITSPDSGNVEILGKRNLEIQKSSIGFLPENPVFFKNITPAELLDLSLSLVQKEAGDHIDRVLSLVDLLSSRNDKVKNFSKGMVQRLGIAQAIIHDPEILIMDEPMSGLDPIGRKMVKRLMLEKSEQGKTVLFSTHNLDDIEVLCDEVILVKSGQVVIDRDISQLRESNAYLIEFIHNKKRESKRVSGYDAFWQFMTEIKNERSEIIRIQSDLSMVLEKHYEE